MKYENIKDFTIILAHKDHTKYGALRNIDSSEVQFTDNFNSANEFSIKLYKYMNGEIEPLWDEVISTRLIYVVEFDEYYEIDVQDTDCTNPYKTLTCTSACEAELSQIMLYDIEINTDTEIENTDALNPDSWVKTTFYDADDTEHSLLHRILDKAPHYSIGHVDRTLYSDQLAQWFSFSINGTSIYDFLTGDCANEFHVLFLFDSSDRTISVYDLYATCLNPDCSYFINNDKTTQYRGDFRDTCPKCGSTNVSNGYGTDTKIYVDVENLTDEITFTTDKDSIKNALKLEAGDDTMTDLAIGLNPNGSSYVRYFDPTTLDDMSDELVEKINSYDDEYDYYENKYSTSLDDKYFCKTCGSYLDSNVCPSHGSSNTVKLITYYNSLVSKYKTLYKDCFDYDLNPVGNPLVGYAPIITAYNATNNLYGFLNDSLMPTYETTEINATTEAAKLNQTAIGKIGVSASSIGSMSQAVVTNSVLSYAKFLIMTGYVKIETNTASWNASTGIWTGNFKITNNSDDEDIAYSPTVNITITNDYTYTCQKIAKEIKLHFSSDDTNSVTDICTFSIVDDDWEIDEGKKAELVAAVKLYSFERLKNFVDGCDTAISTMIEQGYGSESNSFYKPLYYPYTIKRDIFNNEYSLRSIEVAGATAMNTYLTEKKKYIQDKLDFNAWLGEDLYTEYCMYRREDTYSNSNFISDGLSYEDIISRAKEFLDGALTEVVKAGTPQHTISATLYNLFQIEEFEPLRHGFSLGSFIRIRVNGVLYRLRLLKIGGNISDLSTLEIEFSDVEVAPGIMTDIESVLSSAQSMASTYDSVNRKAAHGNKVSLEFNSILQNGFTSALTNISNNTNEEISLTNDGLIARSYDDASGLYDDAQFRLTHNIMAFTKDNWKTVSTALGLHSATYYFYNESDDHFEKKAVCQTSIEDYGLTSQFVTAGYVTGGHVYGSEIVGGNIYSQNYKNNSSAHQGTHINLIDGTFDFAGGKITYDGSVFQISGYSDTEAMNSAISSQFKVASDEISAEVTRAKGVEGTLSSSIKVNADGISAEVTRAKGSEGSLSTRIDATEEGISTKVSKGSVCSEINQSSDTITMNSNRLIINSTNFTLDSGGNMTATSATMRNIINLLPYNSANIPILRLYNEKDTWTADIGSGGDGNRIILCCNNGVNIVNKTNSKFVNLYAQNVFANNGACYCIYSGKNSIISMDLKSNDTGPYLEIANGSNAYGVYVWESDTKLKKDIEDTEINNALDVVNSIKHRQFNWKSNNNHVELGYVANEIEKLIPDAVYEVEQPEDGEYDTLKNINASAIIPYLSKAIQELSAKVDALENKE